MPRRILFLIFLFSLLSSQAQGQDTCEKGKAKSILDSNNIRAMNIVDAMLYRCWVGNEIGLEIENGSGAKGTETITPRLVGKIDDRLKGFGNGFWETWESHWAPGPLNADGSKPSDCSSHDRIFLVTRADLESYDRDEAMLTDDIRDWPWRLGAPVSDGDGRVDNYNLEGGDRPQMHGDQMQWWNVHVANETFAFQELAAFELGVLSYSFQSAMHAFQNAVFYSYRFRYKEAKPMREAYFGLIAIGELATWYDNYIGVDTTMDMSFVYKSGEVSEFFEDRQPAFGYLLLRGAPDSGEKGEHLGLTGFWNLWKFNASRDIDQMYLNIQSRWWQYDEAMTYGGVGRGYTDVKTKFMYPGEPGEYWSEENVDTLGTHRNPPGWRAPYMISGPFDLKPEEEFNIDFALFYARGNDRFDSVRLLKENARQIRTFYELGGKENPLKPSYQLGEREEFLPDRVGVSKPYPNPSSDLVRLDISTPSEARSLVRLLDLQGRQIMTPLDETLLAGTRRLDISLGDIPPGMYFLEIQIAESREILPLFVAR